MMLNTSEYAMKAAFESIYESDLFINENAKMGLLNGLRLFCDKFDFYGFMQNYDLTQDEYEKYCQPYVQENMPDTHEYAMDEFKKERYGIYPFKFGDNNNESE